MINWDSNNSYISGDLEIGGNELVDGNLTVSGSSNIINNLQVGGSLIADHNTLSNLQGGQANEYYHLIDAEHGALVDGGSADGYHTHPASGSGGGGTDTLDDVCERGAETDQAITVNASGSVFTSLLIPEDIQVEGNIDWSGGNVIYVPLDGDIQTYVNNAEDGDTLVLASGEYTITSTITINKQLNIVGQGNTGFVTFPVTPSHGTLISSSTASLTAFQIDHDNVRIAHLSIDLTGFESRGVVTNWNLQGIVLTNIDVTINCSGNPEGFKFYSSDVVMRNLTFYITSTYGVAIGVRVYNDVSTTRNAVVDCFNVTGTVKGSIGAALGFLCGNYNCVYTITLNLNSCRVVCLAGTPQDWAIYVGSTVTNNSIVNAYLCIINGSDYDVYVDGGNQLNLYGSILVNNKVFGNVTYKATLAAGTIVALTSGSVLKSLRVQNNELIGGNLEVKGNLTVDGNIINNSGIKTILLPVDSSALGDGSTGNKAAQLALWTSTDTDNPKCRHWILRFDDTIQEHAYWQFDIPSDYVSGGKLRLKFYMESDQINDEKAVGFQAALQAVTPLDNIDMLTLDLTNEGGNWASGSCTLNYANPSLKGRLCEMIIDMSSNLNSVAAGDFVEMGLRRDVVKGTAIGDVSIVTAKFEFNY